MSMTKPIGQVVNAFDATTNHTFYFTSSGGNQVVYNRIIIRNNTTNVIVYNNLVESYKFEHIVPSGTLTNGVYYNYTITTYDVSSNASEPSSPIAFYCYSSPTITFTNIPIGNIIQASSFTFDVTYDQAQDELLDTLTINLYNASGVLIDSSVGLHNSGNPPLDFSYTFNGFTDDTIYKISASAVSVNGTVTNSPMIQFITSYFSPSMYSILELTNNCSGGYVEIKNNMIIIEGESLPSPPNYIESQPTSTPIYTLTNSYDSYGGGGTIFISHTNKEYNFSTLFPSSTANPDVALHKPLGSVACYLDAGSSYTLVFANYSRDVKQVISETAYSSNERSWGGHFLPDISTKNNVYYTSVPQFANALDSIRFINGSIPLDNAINYEYLKEYYDFGKVEVDLRSSGAYVRWVEGYNIASNFTMGLWGRSYTRNVPICTFANANNGKIVVKFIDDYQYGETTLKTVAELTVYDISNNPQYTIYSNYIETTDITNDVFIWVRRINNIFEIKVEV